METKIINQKISQQELKQIAQSGFGEIVKFAVDVEKEIIALGGELHSDCQEALIEDGSDPKNIWGANIYPQKPKEQRLEFFALINIKPKENPSMRVEEPTLKARIKEIVDNLIE